MKLLLKILLFFFPVIVKAQSDPYIENWSDQQIDSIHKVLLQTPNDTLRMRLSRSLGWYYQEKNRDSSLFFHEQELDLARKLNLKLWEADALDQTGWVLSQLKNYPRSLQYFLDAIEIAGNTNCERNIWQAELFDKGKNKSNARLTVLGFIYNDMSQLYKSIGNNEKELSCLLLSLKIGGGIDNYTMLSTVSVNLSEIYLGIKKLDSSVFYAQQALALMDKTGYTAYKGFVFTNLGNVFLRKHDFVQAKQNFEKSVFENLKQKNRTGLPYSYLCLADLFRESGNKDSSIYYTKKAMVCYSDVGLPEGVNNCYASLYSLYKLTGNNDSAFRYIQAYKTLNDSLNESGKVKINEYQRVEFNEKIRLQELQNERIRREDRNRTNTLFAAIGVFMLITFLLFRNNRNKRKANELLQKQKEEIEIQKKNVEGTLTELKMTQVQLIQSEKMASLGELTAGIAHEIQNPLNFINNFSEVNTELIDELEQELGKENLEEVKALAKDIRENEQKINHHGKRADGIVKGMLQHSRSSSGVKEPTDINALADEYLRLAYHGLRAKDKTFNASIHTDFDPAVGTVNVVPQDIGRVILNLITNAFYVVDEKKKGSADMAYEPAVTVKTERKGDTVLVSVKDNGNGIPAAIRDKIFQPFFTTKPTGKGTGLGLSMSYDIVKAHGGELKVETNEGNGSEFIISLPAS